MSTHSQSPVLIVGAGIGGLAAALRLAARGVPVKVLERHGAPGGKMRALPSAAGPVDTGPTVLTMRHVFDDLFAEAGAQIEDHITLVRQPMIARHFWPDGSTLDLFDNPVRNAHAVEAFAGARAAKQFQAFDARTRALFEGFDAPMMQAAQPKLIDLITHVATQPRLAWQMAPLRSLAGLLQTSFDDPRLCQLFGRYATYVGGSPYKVPALLALIWHAEVSGVWAVKEGMHALARAIEDVAKAHGAQFEYNAHVEALDIQNERVTGLWLADGTRITGQAVLFNGDPRALATGALGTEATKVAPQTARTKRSLSAEVWAFAARPQGPELAHHNVFFRDDPAVEFAALARGDRVPDPTIYVCAMDRGLGPAPEGLERFETIANAAPVDAQTDPEDLESCQTRTFRMLDSFGLTFSPTPSRAALTTPQDFATLFPASTGSLYGQSPHGTMAAFQRPTARTKIAGLYLAGGGAHPGAGVPMATLSARHAAEAILTDLTSISPSRPMAMRGGMSTGSATMARAPSPSSGS